MPHGRTGRAGRGSAVALFVSTVALLAPGAPASAFGPPESALSALTASQAQDPVQIYAPEWVSRSRRVQAGGRLSLKLDPVTGKRCTVTLARRGSPSLRVSVRGGLKLSAIAIRTSRRARSGRWTATAACRQPVGPRLLAMTSFAVRGGGSGALAPRSAVKVRRVAPYAGGPAGRTGGKGATPNFDKRQCTSWAYEKRPDVYHAAVAAGVRPSGLVAKPAFSEDYQWNGKRWAENARRAGIPTGTKPVAGALFVDTVGRWGHVAFVERVLPNGSFEISERNASGSGKSTAVTPKTLTWRPGVEFVYGGPAGNPFEPQPSDYIGHIVQWDGDRKSQRTAWLVGPDGKRRWIPTIAVYDCLKARGHPGPTVLSASMLDRLPDLIGTDATCTTGGGGDPPPVSNPSPGTPSSRVIVVDNRVTNGMGMREDATPVRLTTQPWIRCGSRGCNIGGTERSSGGTYDAAICTRSGERTTNGNDSDPADDANPERFESTRYYGVRLSNGTFGYVSEVWIRAADRGGLGLPGC